MSVPSASSVFSVRSPARSLFSSAAPEASLRSASPKLSVMSPDASVTVVPSAGLNTGPATLVSTVNVADAATPRLPCASK